ncbi:DUF397 domain-containing protein [Streptomyces sp. NPDC004726]
MLAEDRVAVSWRRSSYSGTNDDNNCCEVALFSGGVRVRDSKRPGGDMLHFTPGVWRSAKALFLHLGGAGRSHE